MGSIPTEPTGGVGAGEDRGAEVDLNWSAAQAETRLELRRWFEGNLAAWRAEIGTERSGDTREGFEQQLLWEARLYDAGWSAVSWPRAFGGRDGTLWDWLIFEEEYWRAGAPQRVTQNGIQILAPSIFEHGTQAQKDHLLPRIAAANDLWCQGWSEPNAGSDLAAVSSRARRTAGGWVLDGQKTWTTRGAFCTHLFGLFRSDPASERHRGLTYLLVPLDLDGITVRGFGRLDGDEGFAEVFFTEAFLPEEAVGGGVVLGEVDRGWRVAVSAASTERGLLRSPGRYEATVASLLALCSERGTDASMRRRIAAAWMRADAYRLPDPADDHSAHRRPRPRIGGEPDQGLVVGAGHRVARDRSRPAGPRRRVGGPRRRVGRILEQGPPVLAGRSDLRGDQRGAAQHRGRARPRPAAMRFALRGGGQAAGWRPPGMTGPR